MYTKDQNLLIEKAICFLVKKITESGHNPKPVILHSIRVAMMLYADNYDENIIVAALLHDLLEDTACTPAEISQAFGTQVTRLVSGLTFDDTISDKKVRFKNEIDKAITNGKETALIKAADLIDNSHFYHLASKDLIPLLVNKFEYFTRSSRRLLKNEPIWKKLITNFCFE